MLVLEENNLMVTMAMMRPIRKSIRPIFMVGYRRLIAVDVVGFDRYCIAIAESIGMCRWSMDVPIANADGWSLLDAPMPMAGLSGTVPMPMEVLSRAGPSVR